ncbi:LysR family transcriptional regulator [uncultured Pseudoteredinibacter sp.]|uniref:LysR family transcriptional regulator n=1 Tax=uncultured Pseudoteredinibacter sp. TaxID=1641701 RepID=UPI002636FF61|nr:LysR family transcriptional regulator [uncultured Pseudoteredinibacter sp.]
MDTQSLSAFCAVAELRSFSAAAQKLHLTQPAVSKRISGLEEQLDCKLFDRIGRTVDLTEAGRTLLPRANKILMEVEETRRLISDKSGEISGTLNMATSHHIGLHRLPPVLRQFSQQYPKVKLAIDFIDSEKATDKILHGQLELAVVTLAPQKHEKMIAQHIWHDPLICVVAQEHPLNNGQAIELKTLSEHPAILPDLSTFTGQILKRQFDQFHLPLDVSMATNYLETIKMMVSIGLGWSVLPESLIDGPLTSIDVPQLEVSRELGCIYHEGRSLSKAAQAFIQALQRSTD